MLGLIKEWPEMPVMEQHGAGSARHTNREPAPFRLTVNFLRIDPLSLANQAAALTPRAL